MDVELVRGALGPVVTALATGAGVAVRQAWQNRDARQRARRRLRDASAEIAFIRDWVAVQGEVWSGEDAERNRARARDDLQAIYEQVFVESHRAHEKADLPSSWTLERVFNAVVALRIPVPEAAPVAGSFPGPLPVPTPGPVAEPDGEEPGPEHRRPRYRRPLGAARVLRPVYWASLGWTLVWAMASFSTVTRPQGGETAAFLGGVGAALFLTVVGAVLPAAGLRVLVVRLDEHEVEQARRRRLGTPPSPVRVPGPPSAGWPVLPVPTGHAAVPGRAAARPPTASTVGAAMPTGTVPAQARPVRSPAEQSDPPTAG